MSENSDRIASMYKQLIKSEGGKNLLEWIEKTSNSRRKAAGKLEPVPSWGELKFADGLDEVKTHIQQMSGLNQI